MSEIVVKVPKELREFESISPINWQLIVGKRLKEEFDELVRLKKIVAKSKLTEEQARELADEVSMVLSKRFLSKS